ncbi:alkylhydroperoxidase AhpD family core domain-containing protein [Seinonella peptonophila]|uniref:Alkylhydroperoxidase AhpD family core domain-containing protein n=1 Tax=Seinonella peptonophila TaxID=112248 RepID=A0A1M4SND7_9BACL|nr:carboxymuconolactone decarboxylase family protein [Seinonella peptonophila]SHE33753.1 alkylhydroperoxidase AhpD family core domain-containing protein [Seinonella peptonophila]
MEFKEQVQLLGQLPKLIQEPYQRYRSFSNAIWNKGVLTVEEKEVIAIAVAHSTKCAYCIRFHTRKAKHLGISIEKLLEAATITASIEAASPIYYRYEKSELDRQAFPHHIETTIPFIDSIDDMGHLSTRIRILIAFAVNHLVQIEQLQDQLVNLADESNIVEDEIREAILVAAALKAGGAISHTAELINEYLSIESGV